MTEAMVPAGTGSTSGTGAAAPISPFDHTIKTYRYLRLAMVVMVIALGASVVLEVVRADCWQSSISAYYYTPAHAVFIGALVTIGVCLITIKGVPEWEDVLLNVAGMLAPVVAFVPTSPPTSACVTQWVRPDPESFVNNNVLALFIGGALAVGCAYFIASRQQKVNLKLRRLDPTARWGVGIAAAIITAGVIWYFTARGTFLKHAHLTTAGLLIVAFGIVVLINSRTATDARYRRFYRGVAWFMGLAAVGVGVAVLLDRGWKHAVLWIEALEIIPFAVFWTAQTLEHWNAGVKLPPPPTE